MEHAHYIARESAIQDATPLLLHFVLTEVMLASVLTKAVSGSEYSYKYILLKYLIRCFYNTNNDNNKAVTYIMFS